MSLINDREIPAGGDGIACPFRILHKELDAGENQLFVLKRILAVRFHHSFGVKEAELEIKTAPHFHQPLMEEGIWYHNQHPLGPSRDQLVVKNQAGFNGFAEADLIG